MKVIFAKSKKAVTLCVMLLAGLVFATQVSAHCHRHYYRHYFHFYKTHVPHAVCGAYATNAPLPPYVCCQLRDREGRPIWRDTWVPGGSCRAAHPGARYDFGCSPNSPVLDTGAPIYGNCVFSPSTRDLPRMHW